MLQKLGRWLDQVAAVVTIASEVGVAVFTAIVALVELTRFLQGPKISVSVDSLIEKEASPIVKQHPRHTILSEDVDLRFPIVFSNTGPRGGSVTGIEFILVNPPSELPLTEGGEASGDTIVCEWAIGEVTYQPIFSSGGPGALSLKDNESKALMTRLGISIRDKKDSEKRAPKNTFLGLQQKYPHFEFQIQYKSTAGRRGTEVVQKKSFRIHLKLRPSWIDQ